eukprot:COSAG06_NODE_1628_length_8880_cov_51.017993_1_plen_171_part_00
MRTAEEPRLGANGLINGWDKQMRPAPKLGIQAWLGHPYAPKQHRSIYRHPDRFWADFGPLMSKYRGRFGHFQGQPEMFSNDLLAQSRRALAYRGQNVGNRCLLRVLENLRIRAVSRPFFCIFDRFIPKNRQLRAPTHFVRSIQLGIERGISSTGFRHPNENWGHYPLVPN